MRKIILLICFVCCAFCSQAQDIPIEKFIGVWHASKEPWNSRTMRISQENGKIILQVKDLIFGEATLNGNRLKLTVVDEVKYGKFWVGSWGGWYDSDHEWVAKRDNYILVGHSDGGYGTNGEVGGFYSESYRRSKANKEISYLSVHVVYKYEGTLELYYTYHSTYFDGNIPLFYQGREDDMYRFSGLGPHIYTNW